MVKVGHTNQLHILIRRGCTSSSTPVTIIIVLLMLTLCACVYVCIPAQSCDYDFLLLLWGTYTSIIVTTADNHGESRLVGEVPEHHGHTGTTSGNY